MSRFVHLKCTNVNFSIFITIPFEFTHFELFPQQYCDCPQKIFKISVEKQKLPVEKMVVLSLSLLITIILMSRLFLYIYTFSLERRRLRHLWVELPLRYDSTTISFLGFGFNDSFTGRVLLSLVHLRHHIDWNSWAYSTKSRISLCYENVTSSVCRGGQEWRREDSWTYSTKVHLLQLMF